ncbi:MAG TPA: hypothetical protein VFS88_06100, partial [Micavibrio sp.]|nr:hypothetical protein [Micavibrio sp.]
AFSNPDPEAAHHSNDNDTVAEQTRSALKQIAGLLQDETLPPEIKEKLAALSQEIAAALPEKNFASLETAMTSVRETLVDFAASDSISPQTFRAVSDILPSIVVAEKQIGEAAALPSAAENVKREAPDASRADPAQIMNDLSLLAAGKIEVILQDETVAPEIKERLREIAGTMEAASADKDFSKFAQAVIVMHEAMSDPALPQPLADSTFNARVVSVLAAITPEILKSLPPDMQQPVLEMQRSIFAASARETVLGQQMIAIGHDKRHALQDLIESSGLSDTERQKMIRELQSGQASVETLRNIVNRVEATTPGLDTNGIRAEVSGLVQRAVQDMSVRTYTVAIDPAIKERVLPALAQLPLPQPMLREIVAAGPVSKPVLAAVIAAAGEKRSPEVNYYIKKATRQLAKEQAKPIVELHKKYPIPGMTPRDLNDLKQGNSISATRMKRIMENPTVPLPVRRKLEEYQVVQNQMAPYVSPKTIQRELVQIQQVLMRTNLALAKSVETFQQRNPDATAADVNNYIAAMPERTRAHFDEAADYVSRHSSEQGFVPKKPDEAVQMLIKASFEAGPHEKLFLDEMAEHIRMGQPIVRSDLDRIADVANFDIHDHSVFSEMMTPSDEKKGVSGICSTPCKGGDCNACRNGLVVALKRDGPDVGAMASVENLGYSFT